MNPPYTIHLHKKTTLSVLYFAANTICGDIAEAIVSENRDCVKHGTCWAHGVDTQLVAVQGENRQL